MAFGPSGSGARRGAMYAIGQQQEGLKLAQGQLGEGYSKAQGFYDSARQGLQPLTETANSGFDRYGDFSGANGQSGLDAARSQFDGSVYGQADKYGEQSVLRNTSKLGMMGSGNAMTALNDYNKNDLIKRYGQYGQALMPYNSVAPGLQSQMAGLYGQQANSAQQYGQQMASLTNGTYNNIAQTGGNAFATSDTTRQQMTNLGMQGLNMLANSLGAVAGMGGGGGGLSSLMGMFGGGGGGAQVPQYSGTGPIIPGGNYGSLLGRTGTGFTY